MPKHYPYIHDRIHDSSVRMPPKLDVGRLAKESAVRMTERPITLAVVALFFRAPTEKMGAPS